MGHMPSPPLDEKKGSLSLGIYVKMPIPITTSTKK
jgi:hypothetical protein